LGEAFKAQLKMTYSTLNCENEKENELEQQQLEKLESEFKKLKKRYALNSEIDIETYKESKARYGIPDCSTFKQKRFQ
jgi:hypothetical protein